MTGKISAYFILKGTISNAFQFAYNGTLTRIHEIFILFGHFIDSHYMCSLVALASCPVYANFFHVVPFLWSGVIISNHLWSLLSLRQESVGANMKKVLHQCCTPFYVLIVKILKKVLLTSNAKDVLNSGTYN